MATYTGPSIVDYLKNTGQPTDYASRAKLAASKGIQGYAGTAQQNTQLLDMLRGSAPQPQAQPQQQPQQPTPQPQQSFAQPQQQQSYGQSGGGDQPPPNIEDIYRQQGWNDTAAIRADINAGGWRGKVPNQGGGGSGFAFTQPTIDLPALYEGLYAKSGISDIEKGLSEKTRQYNEAVSKIKDNPYLSEATMSGRLRKIDEKFNADTQAIRNDIVTKKADIETQLNLQTKQFDINNQQAQQSLAQFNQLLQLGAFDNASGEDIANITRSTGLSSGSINSAIQANKAKNVQTQTISYDDGNNSGFVTINSRTGEIINKQIIAESKPSAAELKATSGGGGGGGSSSKSTKADEAKQAKFEAAINSGIKQLQSGSQWGEVWNRIKALFPDAPPELIDTLLGPEWRNPGAYQKYQENKKGL